MKNISHREEEIMQIVWKLKKAFIREIMELLPEPIPHYNTVATLVKRLVHKQMLDSIKIGNMHQYFPTELYGTYREDHIKEVKKKFFDNSVTKLFTHFAKEENLTEEEKEELIRIIKSK